MKNAPVLPKNRGILTVWEFFDTLKRPWRNSKAASFVLAVF